MANEKEVELVKEALMILREHFETAQIFATRHDVDGTFAVARGFGNGYARIGHVRDWLLRDDEEVRIIVRSDDDD